MNQRHRPEAKDAARHRRQGKRVGFRRGIDLLRERWLKMRVAGSAPDLWRALVSRTRSGVRAFRLWLNPLRLPGPTVVWAVRRDWSVDLTHEFICPRLDHSAAYRAMGRDHAYWRGGPIKPELSLVRISMHDYLLHARGRRLCRAPDCPSPEPR